MSETAMEKTAGSTSSNQTVVVCLGTSYQDLHQEEIDGVTRLLQSSALTQRLVLGVPSSSVETTADESGQVTIQPYTPTTGSHGLAVQTAASYGALNELMRSTDAACGVLLGADADTMQPAALRGLVQAVLESGADLAMPCYDLSPNEGLINSSMLYPVSRAVFAVEAQFPLALDVAMSPRMAAKMAVAAPRSASGSSPDALLWPASEAAVSGFRVAEVTAGRREVPHPTSDDLSSILGTVASALFNDVEVKASFWQRTRPAPPLIELQAVEPAQPAPESVPEHEVAELVEAFRMGYGSLHEIWALVLPPQSLLGLKRLSRMTTEEFVLPDALWVRIVYDFALAHRQRTINRGHLLGALTPLYLAWVASHIRAGQRHGSRSPEALARAFEADKPYLVSRWRWPDRFNP